MAKKAVKKAVVKTEELEEVVVTQEILDSNPELAEQGVEIGDTVQLPAEDNTEDEVETEDEEVAEAPKTTKKTKGATAILKGDTFIREYEADQADLVAEFLTKDANYTAVPVEAIEKILVAHDVMNADKSIARMTKVFSRETDGEDFIKFAILFKNEERSSCVVVMNK